MKMYLDIDGVLLGTHKGSTELAYGASEFLLYAAENFDCYWLTTHCKGDVDAPMEYLRKYVDRDTFEVLKRVKATHFDVFKTEALSPEDDFLWIDDQLLRTEQDWLESNSIRSSWIQINTYKNFYDLNEFYHDLKAN